MVRSAKEPRTIHLIHHDGLCFVYFDIYKMFNSLVLRHLSFLIITARTSKNINKIKAIIQILLQPRLSNKTYHYLATTPSLASLFLNCCFSLLYHLRFRLSLSLYIPHYKLNRTIITMAAFTFTTASGPANFGRSGYNKDGDSEDDKRNFGRSGYNKGDDEDDKKNFGRSGYNKDGDDEDSRLSNFGRSGYN
ncbi:uncharacterized protein F4812DRAFT_76625 [Daldinia caldariorum]|uniref:uncharacterized protein n=1 Tax=Daldinia caldariorum TaxID=326644 RepID=UPI0020078FC2|nr:uncharacterized protein F4812DRAFT_76625 [Daldinia caldariorum]KAI1466371.1 hypothetical protein F4812DRAFT_76625 [Daldinia caldariorum]